MNSSTPDRNRATPEDVREAWVAAVASRDPEALRPLLSEDYEVWANGAPPLHGADAAVEAMRAAMDRYHITQSFEPVESVITGDWAFERGVERMTITPVAGGPTQTMTQRALLILRRDADGQWQYARGMTNGLPPTSDRSADA
jgi:ketosteroid isomerase-like protein